MPKLGSKGNSTGNGSDEIHTRWNYVDHSLKFVDWVNRLGVERTFFGRLAYYLDHHLMVRKLVLLFFFVFALSFLITFDIDFVYTRYHLNELATTNIKSPLTFEMVDELETNRKRDDAETAIPPVFDFDISAYDRLVGKIYLAFRDARKLVVGQPWPKNETLREEKIKDFLKYQSRFEEMLGGIALSTRTFEWLVEKRFSVHLENLLIRLLEERSTEKIADNITAAGVAPDGKALIRIVEKGGGGEEFTAPVSSLLDRGDLIQNLNLDKTRGASSLEKADRAQLLRLAQTLLVPNLILNLQETTDRRTHARASVLPTNLSIKKGQVIVANGSVVQMSHVKILEKIQDLRSAKSKDFHALVIAILLVTLIVVSVSYLRRFTQNRVLIEMKDFVAMGFVTVVIVMICRAMMFLLGAALEERFAIPPSAFSYILPASAATMLVGLLIASGEIVWIFTVFMAVVLSLVVGSADSYLIVAIVGGIAGARGVFKCRKRNDIYFAGLRVGGVNALMIAVVTLVTQSHVRDLSTLVLWNSGAGFLSGVLSSLIAMMAVPLLETIFNYTTDVRLLELGNLDHPLMREMIQKAPGTYHHSLIVGSMVEAASEEIGANPLLAKVASYYHDIGKTGHSQYFIENQKPGKNPHDHLSPHLSKTVLISHVKDGVELAIQYKLGKPIIDVIIQHHGTTLISFFYNRAKERQEEDMPDVAEEDFRYPGPRPQFREAALCMLADSIEAAARSLDEPTPIRLQNIVKNIIHRKFMDGQLEECNLTLRDLGLIEQSFIRILLGIYHQRIDYPRQAGGGASESPTASITPSGSQPAS